MAPRLAAMTVSSTGSQASCFHILPVASVRWSRVAPMPTARYDTQGHTCRTLTDSQNQRSDYLKVIFLGQFRVRIGGQRLIPKSHRSDIVLQGEVTTAAAPSQRLDCYA